MSVSSRDVIITAVRIVTFIVTMIPLAALFTPWVTLDGSVGTRSGAGCITCWLPLYGSICSRSTSYSLQS